MDTRTYLAKLMKGLRTDVTAANLTGRTEIGSLQLSHEGWDEAQQTAAKAATDSLEAIIDTNLTTLSAENLDVEPYQKEAGKKIALLAMNVEQARIAMASPAAPRVHGAGKVISHETFGIDAVDGLGNESYDVNSNNNALYFSLAYNIGASRQDPFGELWFPTIVMDPMVSGFVIETEYTALMKEVVHSESGASSAANFEKTPIAKAIYDNDIFGNDKTRLIPVYRTASADKFVAGQTFTDKSTGTEITTGPLKFDQIISLLGISQTDASLNKGMMDNTDSIDKTASIKKLWFSLTGSNGTDTVTEMFSVDISLLPHHNFVANPQSHNKEMIMNFTSEAITLKTGTSLTTASALSTILGQLTPNMVIRFRVNISGKINTAVGDINMIAGSMEIVEIIDANGVSLATTSSEYTTIKAALTAGANSVKLEGWFPEAFLTNSNMRVRGDIVTSERYSLTYNVPPRSGNTVLMPTNVSTGTDGDASKVASQVELTSVKTSFWAVKTLIDYADILRFTTQNGVVIEKDILGIGSYDVYPYYNERNLEMGTIVDSVTSSDRLNDLAAAFRNQIKEMVVAAYNDSNYVAAHQLRRGDSKIGVLIGADNVVGQYLLDENGKMDLGENFDVRIATTKNPLMTGKIMISFGVFDDNTRNTIPNPLNFGQCAWAPVITTDVVRTVNNSTSRELLVNPRFLHIVNLPIICVINVTDINGVLGKLAAYRKSMAVTEF